MTTRVREGVALGVLTAFVVTYIGWLLHDAGWLW